MIKIIIVFGLTGFATGYALARILQRKKAQDRRDRRNRIIEKSWSIVDMICRWEISHDDAPKLLEAPKKIGQMIFKGGVDKMTEAQFSKALWQKGTP